MIRAIWTLTVLIMVSAPLPVAAQDFDFLVGTYLIAGESEKGEAYSGTAKITEVDGGTGYTMTRCIGGDKEVVSVHRDKFVLGGDGPIVAYKVKSKEAEYKYRVFVDLNNYATLVGYGNDYAHEHLIHVPMDKFECENIDTKGEE